MKGVLFFLPFLIYTLGAENADALSCRYSTYSYAIPEDKEIIPSNGSIIVTTYPKAHNELLFFESGEERIEAIQIKEWYGYRKVARQYKPSKAFTEGKSYSLQLFDERYTWIAGPEDTTAPNWIKEPTLFGFQRGHFRSQYFVIETEVRDDSLAFYEAFLEIEGEEMRSFYILGNDLIWVGRDGCSGKFRVAPGKESLLRLIPYDFSGNQGETRWVALPAEISAEKDVCVEEFQCKEADILKADGGFLDSWKSFQWN